MKRHIVLLSVLLFSYASYGQQPANQVAPTNATIERVDFSGLTETRLSSELRADIQRLVGQTYSAETVEALTRDIQVELPEFVAAATTQPGTQPDRVRLLIVVAKISDNEALKANINSRYIVDAVEFEGVMVHISDSLNADLQQMVGGNVDSALLGKLGERIASENGFLDLIVNWKLRRSAAPQHVRVVYEARRAKNSIGWYLSGGAYHSRQGWSAPTLHMSYRYQPVGSFDFWMINSADELIERNAGYGVGYRRSSGTFQFGVFYSSYRAQWKTNTLEADSLSSESPGLYRLRDTLFTRLTFSLPLNLSAETEASFTELQMQSPTTGFQKANTLTGTLRSSHRYERTLYSQEWDWSYRIDSGTGIIDSDFIYTKHLVQLHYQYTRQRHMIQLQFQGGKSTGNAPMFERFSIGNSSTLRGWNKYEINPLGGDRMLYSSASYSYRILTGFYDVGSVWDSGQDGTTRHSVGFRIGEQHCHSFFIIPNPQCLSVAVGFPINGGKARPAFILGFGL